MKDLIKKILREETSGLTDGKVKAGYGLMNMITKGYHWYITPYGIWLINPKTEEWMFELEKSGDLWYYYETSDTFYMYLNMEESDFQSFIKIWVEDALKRGAISTPVRHRRVRQRVEDALKIGVISTHPEISAPRGSVENALKNGKKLK